MTNPYGRWFAVKYGAARIRQTPQTFSNWPSVAAGLVKQKVGAGSGDLTFKIRNGQQITVPNLPGARVPPYEVFGEDTYDVSWFLGDLAQRPIHVYDIGAHVGTFATWLCHVHPQATVECFEPAPATLPYLRRNVADNGLDGRITVHAKALAGHTGFATFDQEGAGSGHNHLAMGEDIAGSASQVETLSFDDAVQLLGAPDLVKMDCEGGEYDMVYKSSPESWASVQRLVLEFHDIPGEAWAELRAWFAGIGFHVVRNASGHESAELDLGTAWLSRTPLADHDKAPGRSRASTLAYEAKRVVQTPVAFSNWPSLLSGLVREKAGRGPDTLSFRSRSGISISAPNIPGARLPAYEQFAEDGYRLEWFLKGLQGRPIHVLDVGAHVGTFACHLAQVHPTCTITCFEPSAGTAKFLRANIDANRFSDRISVVEAAVTGESGFATFDDHGGASVHSGLVHGDDAVASHSAVQIPTMGFDDVIAGAPAPVELIKLDCEGGEYQMAYRSSPESWASVQRVVLEYHDIPGESWKDLRAWFATVGLHVVLQKPERADLGLAWLSRGPVE